MDRNRVNNARKKFLSRPSCTRANVLVAGVVVALVLWVNSSRLLRNGTRSFERKLLYLQSSTEKASGKVELTFPEKSEWTAAPTLVETENWDEEKGGCGEASDSCTITFRLPPQPVWHMKRVINRTRGILDLEHPVTGDIDAGFVCRLANVTVKEDHWVTKGEPLIDTFTYPGTKDEVFDVVHHMDLFFCERGLTTTTKYKVDSSDVCAHDVFMPTEFPANLDERKRRLYERLNPTVHPTCVFGPTYDRGAGAFECPDNTGYLIGPSATNANEFILQAHYLVPETIHIPVWDSSGFKITLEKASKSPKKHRLTTLALNDYGLKYPLGVRAHNHSYELPQVEFKRNLRGDFEDSGAVQPLVVHLHAHKFTKQIWVDHLRGGNKIGEYGRIDAYVAHSEHQNYLLLPERDRKRPLLPGDSLRVNCVMDTRDSLHPILYGVSHNTEMCAILLLYTSFGERNASEGNLPVISYCTEMDLCM